MKRRSLLSCLAATLFSLSAFAGGEHNQDAYRIGYQYDNQLPSLAVQQALTNSSVWQNFLSVQPNWMARFDERTGLPHRAFGTPFSVGVASEATAKAFLSNSFGDWQIPMSELEFLTKTETADYEHLILQQRHQGLIIKNARADFKFTKDGRLVLFGLDVHPSVTLPGGSELTQGALEGFATTGLPNVTDVDFEDYFIYPFPGDGIYDYRKIAEFTVYSQQDIPAIYTTYVDVNDGTVLYRENKVHTMTNDTTHVHGDVRTGRVWEPQTKEPFGNVEVDIDGTTIQADAFGEFVATLNNPSNVIIKLRGEWVSVRIDPTILPVASATLSVTPTSDTLDISDLFTVEARSAYYHTELVHNHMKRFFPNFTGLDLPLPCNIEITPHQCNAFYDGSSINFYTAATSCYSLAQVKDVVYHEYGHGINGRFYSSNGISFSNGGMNEGYADIWGISITQDSILAQGITPNDTSSSIRRYDQGLKVYPDDWSGQVHNDGEIIAGSFWDSFRYTGLDMDSITYIWSQGWFGLPMQPHTLSGTGQLYYDVLLETLAADDVVANGGDNDITNGTPNGLGITRGFNDHGITLMGIIDLTHAPVASAATNQSITLSAAVNVQFNQYFGGVTAHYQIDRNGTWNTVPMTNTSGINYEGQIPAQPSGTIIDYYVTLDDVNGLSAIETPSKASNPDPEQRNLAFNILVGYNQMHIEDFDFNQGSWTEGLASDGATTGMWTIDVPDPTYAGNDPSAGEVQPGSQNTPGGFICAVTGNNGGGVFTQDDVDGGETTLISPELDLTGYTDPLISYYRWFSNNTGSNPGTDPWIVYMSNDGGATWTEIENTRAWDQSWRRAVHRVSDFMTPTGTVSIRFVASDFDPGAVVEAAIDDLEVWESSSIGLEESEVSALSIYPNPVAQELTLDFDLRNNQELTVQVVDITGRVLIQEELGAYDSGNHKVRLNVQGLARGTYQLVLSANGTVQTKTFVKQ